MEGFYRGQCSADIERINFITISEELTSKFYEYFCEIIDSATKYTVLLKNVPDYINEIIGFIDVHFILLRQNIKQILSDNDEFMKKNHRKIIKEYIKNLSKSIKSLIDMHPRNIDWEKYFSNQEKNILNIFLCKYSK